MAKIVYRGESRALLLSRVETLLIFASEFGATVLDGFFPAKYAKTHLARKLIGLDSFTRHDLHVSRRRLIKRNLVAKSKNTYALTPMGKNMLGKLKALMRRAERVWDGQWRIVIFDIPEVSKKYREALRSKLSLDDFRHLQDSVWISKYPLSEEIYEFLEGFGLTKHVCILLTKETDRNEILVKLLRDT